MWDAPSGSPFCAKVVAYCRFVGIDLKREVANFNQAPKKKLSVLIDGDIVVADNCWILKHLQAQ